jgi:Uma2 family endonuclease
MIRRPGTISIEAFDQMIEAGCFHRIKRRVDLIRGEIVYMSAAGPMHDEVLTRLTEWSFAWAARYGCRVRTEKGVKLPPVVSVPEPDIVWVADKDYMTDKPYAEDVALLIEVSDSSLQEDRVELVPLYAEAGIAEYWIANCAEQCIEVFRRPVGIEYTEQLVFDFGEVVSPLIAPQAVVDVAGLFALRSQP